MLFRVIMYSPDGVNHRDMTFEAANKDEARKVAQAQCDAMFIEHGPDSDQPMDSEAAGKYQVTEVAEVAEVTEA